MNRRRYVTDNAHMESFFQSMKTECIYGSSFDSECQLRKTLSWYLDEYYNQRRVHMSIGGTNPLNYE